MELVVQSPANAPIMAARPLENGVALLILTPPVVSCVDSVRSLPQKRHVTINLLL